MHSDKYRPYRTIYKNGTRYSNIPKQGQPEEPRFHRRNQNNSHRSNFNGSYSSMNDRVDNYFTRSRDGLNAWVIALGISLGIGIVYFVTMAAGMLTVSTSVEVINNAISESEKTERLKWDAELKRQTAQHEASRAYRAERERSLYEAKERERIRLHNEAVIAKKKEDSWKVFYKERDICKAPSTWRLTVECADEKIRQYKEFEAQYKP